jgi:hypothetical protein
MSQNPYHYAVVVGINRYPALCDLTAAKQDAGWFRKWLLDPNGGGLFQKNTKAVMVTLPMVVTVDSAKPTREAIYAAFDEIFTRVKQVPAEQWHKTRLYLYFAGHGIAFDTDDATLLAANYCDDQMGRHVSCFELLQYFGRVQFFKELVVFADCCRSRAADRVKRVPPVWSHSTLNNGGINKFMALAALWGQDAFEEIHLPVDQRRGYFTRALMTGLEGAPTAIDPGTHTITAESLRDHIREHMRQATPATHVAPLEADFIIGGNGVDFGPRPAAAAHRYPVKLTVKSTPLTTLNIEDGRGTFVSATARIKDQPSTFVCQLPLGLYEAVPGDAGIVASSAWTFKVAVSGTHAHF